MIRLHLLGTVQLQDGDGREGLAVLAQPRRLALLAWLAMHGTVRRDALLGVFWPESDTARARSALRNALHFLRRELGAGAIESVGDGELRVDPNVVWCDALAFEEKIDEGRGEEAMELYRGGLLQGFYVDDAPEFERWVDEERSRLHREAVRAVSDLADEAAGTGKVNLAVHYARHASTLEPESETAVRRLVALQWRAGDRTGALQSYEEFEARLAAEYDLEPTEETKALVRSLRKREPAGASTGASEDEPLEPDRPVVVPAAAEGADPARSPGVPDPEPGDGSGPGGAGVPAGSPPGASRPAGRPGWTRIGAAVIAIVALAGAWLAIRDRAPEPTGSLDVVAILPFSYRGTPELEYLGEGMVTLLSASLDGAGPLRAVETRESLGRYSGLPEDLDVARAVARRLGAGIFIVGDVIEMEGRINVRAALHRTDEGGAPLEIGVEGRAEDLQGLVDELGASLLETRAGSGLERVAVRTSGSIEALKHFLRGESAYRAGRYREAVDDLKRAVEVDTTFALAHYRLSTVATWVDREEIARVSAVRAMEFSGRLSVEDSLLVTAWGHHRTGRVDLAEPLYRRVIELEPDGAEAWFQLGELIFHWGPVVGRPIEASGEAFERVLAVDPDHASALVHLVRVAAIERRAEDLDRWTSRLEALHPESRWALEARTLRDVVLGSEEVRRSALRDASDAPPVTLDVVVNAVAVYARDVDGAIEIAREMVAPERSERQRLHGRILLAELEMARGRWRIARSVLETPGGLSRPRALEFRAMLATLPFLPVPEPELRSLRESLRDSTLTPALPPADHPMWHGAAEFPPLPWEGIHAPRLRYLEGILAARMSDGAGVETAIRDLEELNVPMSSYYADLLRAGRAWWRGDAATTLEALGPVRPRTTFETVLDYPRAWERFLRAEALASEGRWAEAERWYRTFPSTAGHDMYYLAPALLGRARARSEAGDSEGARRAYEQFLGLWAGADRELQPAVERARVESGRLDRR